MPTDATKKTNSVRAALSKVQGGTGKHIDGSILEPLMARPFQSLVMLSDPSPSSGPDGSLRVLPGFHAAATRAKRKAKKDPRYVTQTYTEQV